VGDRNLLDGREEIAVVETYFHPGYIPGLDQARSIDLAIMRLATPVSGIEPITIGARPAVGDTVMMGGFGQQGIYPVFTTGGTFTGQMNVAVNEVHGYGPTVGDPEVLPDYFRVRIGDGLPDPHLEGVCSLGDSGALVGMYRGGEFQAVGMCVADLGGFAHSAILALDGYVPWMNEIVNSAIPEPGSALLLLTGLAGFATLGRRR
jgi:hypothetical protein